MSSTEYVPTHPCSNCGHSYGDHHDDIGRCASCGCEAFEAGDPALAIACGHCGHVRRYHSGAGEACNVCECGGFLGPVAPST